MALNKAMIIGNLGRDPEVRYTQSGTAVTNFSVATNRKWRGKDGQLQEQTEWHRVVVFGRQAENCGKYLSKGRQVYVEGRLQTREWEKDGQKRQTTEIVALTVQFLSNGGGSGGGGFDEPPPYTDSDIGSNSGGGSESGFDQSFDDDDIPF